MKYQKLKKNKILEKLLLTLKKSNFKLKKVEK
jgi:hypothetical protein